MARTDWKNLPDTSTPINAENLKADAEQNILTTGLTENFTFNASDGEQKIPINYVINQVGNKLTLDTTNNEIVIGTGISYVLVSYSVSTYSSSPPNSKTYIRTRILKNGSNVSRSDVRTEGMNNYRPLLSTGDFLIPVQQGDKLSLMLFSNNNALTTIAEYTGVQFTIKAI